ncbi:MAG TPA: class I SAM-dependent methyltransferase [candidate division Zixibacteria bacterium]|nr:class I SAM-dependent methyltransferase [candidate division Zixibacteria bacterium]
MSVNNIQANANARDWQVGIWDKMSDIYADAIDPRFVPVVAHLMRRGNPAPGSTVLDLGTGTGAVAFECAAKLGSNVQVTAVDISPKMLDVARERAKKHSLANMSFVEGSAEQIPALDQSHDIILSSLCMMFVIDRAKAAREIARVLRPAGKFVASVWAGPEQCDLIKFQQTAGSFAPKPPVKGVGPGALADPEPFIRQLSDAGLKAKFETEITELQFDNFQSAWDAMANVSVLGIDEETREKAKSAVRDIMWPKADKPRIFRNAAHYISAVKVR